ncbi:hypothetical protein B5V01_00215 [Mesorhizobium erdmanii]|uniref:Uncharacterized protein n=1 Tax=Mesorhizobium erdmanii TaxID=1777866 RepID=A0A4Q1VPI8_9HYPH|nr:hypothetical protein B5V01_00215 [Mesorhizobium erdmanii]
MHNLLKNRKTEQIDMRNEKGNALPMKLISSTSGIKRTRSGERPTGRDNTITSSDEYAPMDNPELFMADRERRLRAMKRAVKARDEKHKNIK